MKTLNKSYFVWNALRISFWLMIALFMLAVLIEIEPGLLTYLWMVSILPTFIFSIVHLTRYRQKAMAITSLCISGVFVLIFLLGMIGVMI